MNEDQQFDDELEPEDYQQDGPGLFDEPLPDPEPACDRAHREGVLPGCTADEPVPTGADEAGVEEINRPEAPLALYRRYRPDTFAEVIGQEHVTEPLMRAITNNRVNHAYLFSGPRGCGKTTSARILARCLNCAGGLTATPCGRCDSCRALATGGPGSIDVIEIDAASHGRVDDARELREGVYFAPVSSRYKIYIIDEAHMVTKEGFNALLKVVEEPPPHVKFIFATTEPEKVIGTIRSRTHHYPFRLVPPRVLTDYLEGICQQEQVGVEAGVLPLVTRAGAGSVRDSLSVLDQLLGAAGQGRVSYAHAAALLGYTPDALLDEIVDAFAAGDGSGVFSTIDKVISMGQDPRRFAEDLLQRMRDLVIVAQVPDAISSGLIDAPADQAERLSNQAALLGAGELTRAAEVIASGLVAMRGTTAPRLHLELVCSRVLLPTADLDGRGLHARLERLERRLNMAGVSPGQASEPVGADQDEAAARQRPTGQRPPASPMAGRKPATPVAATQRPAGQRPAPSTAGESPSGQPTSQPVAGQCPAGQRPARPVGRSTEQTATQRPPQSPRRTPGAQPAVSQRPAPSGGQRGAAPAQARPSLEVSTADVRRLWPTILDEVRSRKRFTYALLNQEAHVVEVRGRDLLLGFSTQGICENFRNGGSVEVLRDSIVEVMGADLIIHAGVDGGPTTPVPPAAEHPVPSTGAKLAAPPVRRLAEQDVAARADNTPEHLEDEVSEEDEILDESGEDIAQLLVRELEAEILPDEDE